MHDHAVADDALRAWVEDAGGDEVQRVLFASGVVDGVPRVGAALNAVAAAVRQSVVAQKARRARAARRRTRAKRESFDSGCRRTWQRATMS